MVAETDRKFSFTSGALAPETFGVVRFHGEEGLSSCYRFEATLVTAEAELDLREVLLNSVKFTIHRQGGDVVFHGVPVTFEQLQQVGAAVFYRVVMVPKLWRLSLTRHNQVFLDKTVPEIVAACLQDGGLSALDYELRLQKDYSPWEYVCQYGESHLDFISRWLEREGMYYYFEAGVAGEKVIITDSKIAHTSMDQGKTLYYSPPSGLESGHMQEVLSTFFCRQQMLPHKVILKDYNYRRPSLDMTGEAEVYAQGHGDVYIYGEHLRSPEEGAALAKIRAEEILCWEQRFDGESSVPYLRPGYTFDLQDHYRGSFNRDYLTVHLTHEGNQAGYMLSGLGAELGEGERETWYRNTFTVLPAEVQFRPERKTPKARFNGVLNAKIDAAGSGQYAELDEQGRYKIILPFDTSGRKDGKASAWVRMMQPYAGSGHGMHFPLHKGTEVLLSFIDGDPDRPIIAGAVTNPETPSPVNADNQTKSRLVSASGNEFHMEDQAGKERILLNSPATQTFVRLGQPNDPPVDWSNPDINSGGKYGYTLYTSGAISITGNTSNTLIIGENTAMTLIDDNKYVGILRTDTTIGARFNFPMGWENKAGPLKLKYLGFHVRSHAAEGVQAPVVNDVIGDLTASVASKLETAALDQRLAELENQVNAEINQLITAKVGTLATRDDVAGSKNQAVATATETAAERTTAIATESRTHATEALTAANLAVTTINSAVTLATETKTSIESSGMTVEKFGAFLTRQQL
ncbi:MAG: type VI secretion system tip protein TssI/VgrG [Syntrophales bacterium]